MGVCRATHEWEKSGKTGEWTHRVGLLLALLGTTTEAEHQVESRLLLNVIVAEGAAILELLSGEDQTLLVRWDTGELSDYDDEPVKPSHPPDRKSVG